MPRDVTVTPRDYLALRDSLADDDTVVLHMAVSPMVSHGDIARALALCREKGIVSVALVGGKPCKMDEYDYVIHVPSEDTPRIQECQTLVGHILCGIVEQTFFGTHN